jgi:hypothetical protein
MFWVIRGTDPRTNEDFAMVVEARSHAAAEAWALKRSLPYIIIDKATSEDIEEARCSKRLWKHTPDARFTCFGQPIAHSQLACLMATGIATILVLLRNGA